MRRPLALALSLCALGSLSAQSLAAQSGTRTVVLCAGTPANQLATRVCSEVSLTTTQLSADGGGMMRLSLRNLSGDPRVAGVPWSVLYGITWSTREDLRGAGAFADPRAFTETPGTVGRVATIEATPWLGTVGTGIFRVDSPGQQYQDASGRLVNATRGIAGCDLSTRDYLDRSTLLRYLPTYSTCMPNGLSGSLTFGSFMVDRVISPNYFDFIDVWSVAFADGVPHFHGCFGEDITAPETRERCRIVSDTYVGDTFGFPLVTPEPSTWALLGTGLLTLGGVAARRKRGAHRV